MWIYPHLAFGWVAGSGCGQNPQKNMPSKFILDPFFTLFREGVGRSEANVDKSTFFCFVNPSLNELQNNIINIWPKCYPFDNVSE